MAATTSVVRFFLVLVVLMGLTTEISGTRLQGVQAVPRAGYTSPMGGVLQFVGTINGLEASFNGTVDQIIAEHLHKHPESVIVARDIATTPTAQGGKIQPPLCVPVPGQPWGLASTGTVSSIRDKFAALSGRCGMYATSCGAMDCSDSDNAHAKVIFCNDNNCLIDPDCGYLASYITDIINYCGTPFGGVGGQLFDSDQYNIIINSDSC